MALAGHVSVEISSLLYYFLKDNKDFAINVKTTGLRKREIDLIVRGRYLARTKNPQFMRILDKE